MRKLPVLFLLLFSMLFVVLSCKMRPALDLGDTVPESVIWPDTTPRQPAERTVQAVVDSADIFYVGDGSTPSLLQLVSYPSRRDTLMAGKLRPLRVRGNADYGHVVRVTWQRQGEADSVVASVEEIVADSVRRE